MKKVLLATTALALSAGVASAEVALSGSARMGLVYTGKVDAVAASSGYAAALAANNSAKTLRDAAKSARDAALVERDAAIEALDQQDGDTIDALAASQADLADAEDALATAEGNVTTTGTALAAQSAAVAAVDSSIVFDNRMTINIDGSTETSSGLTFGGRLRIRSNDGNVGSVNGARVYMKSGAIEVAVGNIYGALDSMSGMYASEVGLTALNDAGVVVNTVGKGDWGFDSYSSTGSQMGVEAIYSAGAFTGHLSVTDSDAGSASDRVAAYGAYTSGDWTVALGMQDSADNTEDKTVLTVGGKVGDFGVGFAAADNDGVQKIALNGSATFGATTVNGFVADDESGTDTAYGLGVSHDIGGAAVMAGVERDAVGQTRADMGVSFSF